MQCPTCGFNTTANMRFCGMCGRRLPYVCPTCEFVNPAEHRYCGMCGTRLPYDNAAPQLLPEPATPAPAPLPGPPVPSLEGERRLATIILADVQGSTDLMERIGTEAWVEIMNRLLQALQTEVYRFGGHVDQFRGDGLVAFFGATAAHEDDPERAVLAALAMQSAIKPYAAELAAREGIELRLRVGLNTGEVIVASIGDRGLHSEDTAMGGAIALAARMETAAQPGTVLVSEYTYRLVSSLFDWEALGEITVKGISRPVAVYRPLAPKLDARWRQRLRPLGLSVPLVGHDAEFQTLKRCLEGLYNDNRGSIVMVTADEGMGKSLLVDEVYQHFLREEALLAEARSSAPERPTPPRPSWLYGRCRSYDQSTPYSMWLDLLKRWLGAREGESPEEIRQRLQQQAELLWADQWPERYPYLATLLSLPLAEAQSSRLKHLDGEGLRQQIFLVLRSWIEAIVRQGALILVFEDLHWADVTSLSLLEYCLGLCDQEALLWLLVFRRERTSLAWDLSHRIETAYPHRALTLTLTAMTEAESNEFIDRLIGANTLPPDTRSLLLSKAQGNPYFIEELLRSLITHNVLVQDPLTGKWQITRTVTSIDLPDSLHSLLLARIDGLTPIERHVLQAAAVIGPVFWSNPLEVLVNDERTGPLQEHLVALQRSQLILEQERVADLGTKYVFKSNLICDVAYESLLQAQRLVYHQKVATFFEEFLSSEALPYYDGLLAYHYRRANQPRKELGYTLQAADQAQRIYANAEALKSYDRALELLAQLEAQAESDEQRYAIRTQRFEVLSGRREIFFRLGNIPAALSDARALLPLAQQLDDDPAWMIDALLQQPRGLNREERAATVKMVEEALALARQLNDRRREMQSLMSLAGTWLDFSDPAWQETGEEALRLARELGDQRAEVSILIGLGRAYTQHDQLERAMAYLEAAMPISQALDDKLTELNLLGLMALPYEHSGDYYRLLTEYQQKRLQISRTIGHRLYEADSLMYCGQIQGIYLGDYEGALPLLKECLRVREGSQGAAFVQLRIAQIQIEMGQFEEALAMLNQVRLDEDELIDIGRAGFRLVSAILYNALGDEAHLRQALELLAQTRQMADEEIISRQYAQAAACEAAMTHLRLAAYFDGQGEAQAHREAALASSQAAVTLYKSFGYTQIVECVSEAIYYHHSLALEANGRIAEAADYLQFAYNEMMRKYNLIPPGTPFRRTFLENIALHSQIRAAYAGLTTAPSKIAAD